MKIYFYHTRESKKSLEEWKKGIFPGHLLYGLPLLEQYGISSVLHRHKYIENRLLLILYVTKEIFFCREKYDALYGTSFRGLELIIFLRALGIYRKPIIIWHHTALRKSHNVIKEKISCFFYKGIDKMFLFSQKLIGDSIVLNKVPKEKLQLIHWGADLRFYDRIKSEYINMEPHGFISTGKENRDIITLVDAFNETRQDLDIYIAKSCGGINYEKLLTQKELMPNIKVHFTEGVIPYELAKKVIKKKYIVIACLEYSYTVGLTTLVEALALGIPVLCSSNPYFEFDVEQEKIGISIPYGDVESWKKAIEYVQSHPDEVEEMGRNARRLAEERFNLDIFSKEIAETILSFDKEK